jgi:hypothetical protein
MVLGLFPGNEFVEWSDVEDNAVVEIGLKVQVCYTSQLILEIPQFRKEVFLPFDLFGEPPALFARLARSGHLNAKCLETVVF